MRTELMQYLKSIRLGAYGVTDELPFSNSGTPMYLKNAKKIYVDKDQVTVEQFLPTLGALNINTETNTVRVYLTTDAKNTPSDYDLAVSLIRQGKDVVTTDGNFRRTVTSSTTFENDLLVTEFEFNFTRLL